jgi:hypothetical protein
MKLKETKIIFILSAFILAAFYLPNLSRATSFSSTDFSVDNPVIDQGAKTSTSTNFGLGQSLSQTAIGKSTSTNFQLWSGFQYYFKVNSNTLTATSGDSQVVLNWTVPSTFLGIAVSSYEVGVGTVSGSYVFTDRGNVTTYTQTGLTNSTPYFFKIKAKSAGGLFLVFSNEATATPAGSVSPSPTPTGGGGGGGYTPPSTGSASVTLKGLAYPGSAVTILKDGQVAAVTPADPGAAFSVTVSNLAAGSYAFGVYTKDKDGNQSPTQSFPETVSDSTSVTVDSIFLGPSIALSSSIIKKGETETIFGFTVPNSPVTVFTHSNQQFTNQVTSANTGAWSQAFNTALLDLGGHTSQSQTAHANLVSAYSQLAAFQVADHTVNNVPGECKRSDLNCDGRVNLTDFSILLYFWQQANPSNARVDINKSGTVDLTDFSILLYDWTG